MTDALYVKTSTGLVKVNVGEAQSGVTQIETSTYSITETATTAQSYQLGIFAHVLVFVNSVLAVDGVTYGITGGTVLQFTDILPIGTEITVIKFITDGSVCPTPSFAIDSALSDTSENAVQNKVIKAAIDAKTVDCDTALSTTSTNPVQNKVITASINSLQTSIDTAYAKYVAEIG